MEESTSFFTNRTAINTQGYAAIQDHKVNLSRDEAGKQFISNPKVLAYIIKHTIDAFKDSTLEEIVAQLSDTSTSDIVDPGIHFMPTEASSITDGVIRFDTVVDTTSGHICTIDIELQGDLNPGYQLTTRGIYYLSRLISRQLDNVTGPTKYSRIHKVYSIWLCPKTSATTAGGISNFKMQCVQNGANLSQAALAGADMMEMTFVHAGYDDTTEIVKFVNGLYRDRAKLNEIFELQEEVDTYMGFFEEVIEEKAAEAAAEAAAKAAEEGRAEGRAEGIIAGEHGVYIKCAKKMLGNQLADFEIIRDLAEMFDLAESKAEEILRLAKNSET